MGRLHRRSRSARVSSPARATLKGQITHHTLMTVRLLAAVAVGEWSAALVVIFFSGCYAGNWDDGMTQPITTSRRLLQSRLAINSAAATGTR
jgi:hypothetical protein